MSGNPDITPGKTCLNCGKPIPQTRAMFCSTDCAMTYVKPPELVPSRFIPGKQCLECGGPIPWRDGAAQRRDAKFCTQTCKFAYQKQHPPRPRVERLTAPCATCGKPVEYLPSQQGPGRRNNHGSKKLTEEILAECHRRIEAGETQSTLAREFGVSAASMSIGIRFGTSGSTYGGNIYC